MVSSPAGAIGRAPPACVRGPVHPGARAPRCSASEGPSKPPELHTQSQHSRPSRFRRHPARLRPAGVDLLRPPDQGSERILRRGPEAGAVLHPGRGRCRLSAAHAWNHDSLPAQPERPAGTCSGTKPVVRARSSMFMIRKPFMPVTVLGPEQAWRIFARGPNKALRPPGVILRGPAPGSRFRPVAIPLDGRFFLFPRGIVVKGSSTRRRKSLPATEIRTRSNDSGVAGRTGPVPGTACCPGF